MTDCPTVPLCAGQSRFGGKCPASRGDLARDAFCPALGKKVTCATARPTCRMQSALSCICQSTKTARGGTRQRTAHVERQSTRTHVHMTLFRCQNRTVWVLAQRTADHFLQHRMRTSSTCSHTDTFASASVSSLELSLLLAFWPCSNKTTY